MRISTLHCHVSAVVAHVHSAAFLESELNDRQIRPLITGSHRYDSRWLCPTDGVLAYLAAYKKGGAAPARVVGLLLGSLEAGILPRLLPACGATEALFSRWTLLVFHIAAPDPFMLFSSFQYSTREHCEWIIHELRSITGQKFANDGSKHPIYIHLYAKVQK